MQNLAVFGGSATKPWQSPVLLWASLAFAAMGVYPPWVREGVAFGEGKGLYATMPAPAATYTVASHYHFLFDTPQPGYGEHASGYRIDVARLVTQWLSLAAAAAGLLGLTRAWASMGENAKGLLTAAAVLAVIVAFMWFFSIRS